MQSLTLLRPRSRRGALRRCESGVTIIEFGFVAPILCLMILGFLDFAHWSYVRSITIGAIDEVARAASVGGAAVDPTVFEAQVETNIKKVAKNATFVWSKQSYYQFSIFSPFGFDGRYVYGRMTVNF